MFSLFLTNFPFLWFLTFIIITVKLGIFFKLVKFVYKAFYNKYINAQMCYFCCFFRALWLETTWATGAPSPLLPIRWVCRSACAHGEVHTLSFASYLTSK